MPNSSLCFLTATELSQQIQAKIRSITEVMEAHIAQINQVNPAVNAIITLLPEDQLMAQARAADNALAQGQVAGPLFGLPIAHKDLALTQGIRTTFGSPIYKDFVPEQDSLIVERLKKAGAITIGKTNVPEFGAGSQTYNPLFGETFNPYDPSKTCGGSSGGAAVALACGMLPLADGSDMGGSLRNPASFCNVVGFRPSPGRVPHWPNLAAWSHLSVVGPLARTVQDIALMLQAIAGPDARSPISIAQSPEVFAGQLKRDFKDTRIAWSGDLGGLPVDPQVTAVLEAQQSVFTDLGCQLDYAEPDFTDADEIFKVWRAWAFELAYGDMLDDHRNQMKDTVIWNIESGQKLTGPQLARAEIKHTNLYHRVREFMEDYEFLILPVSQVPPFDVTRRYITDINGTLMETYIDWMKSCYYITVTGRPAISVPCGFTPDGLPIGLQIVGRQHDDWGVLQLAYAFEQATEFWRTQPAIALA